MNLQIIHLSDMHFENRKDSFEINIDKMMQAINSTEDADECVVVVSGDLAAKGQKDNYIACSSFIGALFKKLNQNGPFQNKNIEFICVPGNHDIDFTNLKVSQEKNNSSNIQTDAVMAEYINHMKEFFVFAKRRNCFSDDTFVSKKTIQYGTEVINFIMVNTAPFSILGGDSIDMGMHMLNDKQLQKIDELADATINILVLHHSIEWFEGGCKEKLRNIISKKYSLILTGHEHTPVGETKSINGCGNVQSVQGNALFGFSYDKNGFCTVNIDFNERKLKAYSYKWSKDLYIPSKILDDEIKICNRNKLYINSEFSDFMVLDDDKRKIMDYFVFPSLSYTRFKEDSESEKRNVETSQEFFDVVEKYDRIIIEGGHKSGKTVLAKCVLKRYTEQGRCPVYIDAMEIHRKKIERTLENAFYEEYVIEENAFERYRQIEKTEKIVIIDNAQMLVGPVLDKLIEVLKEECGKIFVFADEKIEINVRKQVVNAMVEKDVLHISIKPFLYVKRKKLINNILEITHVENIEEETTKINELINKQVRYFNLNPDFLINFIYNYERDYRFQFASGQNVFNIVYENTIREKIISNAGTADSTIVLNILREIAFYMHFQKRNSIIISELTDIVNHYENEYRQKINIRNFLDIVIKAKILKDTGNEFRFNDRTLVAYFVAQALNQKYNQDEDIQFELDNLLHNLCFGINSDIVLFLAMVTNNPKFVNVIIQGAKKHFSNSVELSFDTNNVDFLMNTGVPVKNSLPSMEEKKKRELELNKQEEDIKLSDLIELVNEYDYTEEDLLKTENQVLISLKYLEILSKALPAFCHNMKASQQDELVELLYKYPNQFLYDILNDIGENFEEFCESIYQDISILRKEKNITEISIDSVKHMIEEISAILVTILYQLVASTATTEQTIRALNAFNIEDNSNYRLQNLMMCARVSDVASFSKMAQSINKSMDYRIEKSIIKYTVREYLLRNNVEFHGETQSLIDNFFKGSDGKKLQLEMAKRQLL